MIIEFSVDMHGEMELKQLRRNKIKRTKLLLGCSFFESFFFCCRQLIQIKKKTKKKTFFLFGQSFRTTQIQNFNYLHLGVVCRKFLQKLFVDNVFGQILDTRHLLRFAFIDFCIIFTGTPEAGEARAPPYFWSFQRLCFISTLHLHCCRKIVFEGL